VDAVIGQAAGRNRPMRAVNLEMADVLLFVRQFSVKLKAGLSVEKCLAALGVETRNRTLRNVCRGIHAQVAQGCPLTLALREHHGVFDDCVVRLVENGEQTGNLKAALPSVAQYLEHIGRLRRATHNAVAKPLDVLSMVFLALFIAVVILAFLAKEILPGANGVHHGVVSGADQIALHVSRIVRMFWPFVGVAGALNFLALRLAPNYPRSRVAIDWLAGKLPLVSSAFFATARACFARTVGILMSGGATLGEGMEIAARTAGNPSTRGAITLTIQKIETGRPYVEALIEAGFLRRRDVNAICSAERRGELGAFMLTLADGYEREASAQVQKLATVVHCSVVVVVGLAVMFAALTLYVPVFILR
jgi:type IV pilus assembly protein PilC